MFFFTKIFYISNKFTLSPNSTLNAYTLFIHYGMKKSPCAGTTKFPRYKLYRIDNTYKRPNGMIGDIGRLSNLSILKINFVMEN